MYMSINSNALLITLKNRKISTNIMLLKYGNLFYTTYLTAPNIAARVSKVVIAIVTRPGMDSGGRKSDNHATITNRPLGRYV